MAIILDGKAVAAKVKDGVKAQVEALAKENKRIPCLAVILVGEDPASAVYVRNKKKDCEEVAEKIAELIKKTVPDHLIEDWMYYNDLASIPVLDTVVEELIEKGILTPPENGLGAEGCWVSVER